MSQKILSVTNLSKYYKLGGAFSKGKEKVHAVETSHLNYMKQRHLALLENQGVENQLSEE
jgi:ABC-type glutathione transport system ATPase component